MEVAAYAERIQYTALVPDWLRGHPDTITAVIMYGREVGLPPMTALRTLYIVSGRPAMYAETMRALVLARGHTIEYGEATAHRCVVRGRRRGETTWHEVVWTSADARQAGLERNKVWGQYPRAMLKNRATAELCRDLFADVIGGFDVVDAPTEPAPRGRVVSVVRRDDPEPEAAPPAFGSDAEAAPAPPVTASAVGGDPGPEPAPDDGPGPPLEWITQAQSRALHAAFGRFGIIDRSDRLGITEAMIGRPITSSTDLTKAEASNVLDNLAEAERAPDPQAILDGFRRLAGLVINEPMFDDEGKPRSLDTDP